MVLRGAGRRAGRRTYQCGHTLAHPMGQRPYRAHDLHSGLRPRPCLKKTTGSVKEEPKAQASETRRRSAAACSAAAAAACFAAAPPRRCAAAADAAAAAWSLGPGSHRSAAAAATSPSAQPARICASVKAEMRASAQGSGAPASVLDTRLNSMAGMSRW